MVKIKRRRNEESINPALNRNPALDRQLANERQIQAEHAVWIAPLVQAELVAAPSRNRPVTYVRRQQ